MKQWMCWCLGASALAACGDAQEIATIEQGEPSALSESALSAKVDLGEITYGGSGCSAGSVDATVKTKSVKVEFSELGIGGNKWRSVCHMGLPFTLKKGYQLGLTSLKLLATVDPNDDATLRITKFFPIGDQATLEIAWPPSETEESPSFDTVWSECGQPSIARWSFEVRSKEGANVDLLESTMKLSVRACD